MPVGTSGTGANLNAAGYGTPILLSNVLMRTLCAATGVLLNDPATATVATLTMTSNALDQHFMLASADTSLIIAHSIVWDAPAVEVAGDGSVTSIDNNSHDVSTLPGLKGDPGFIEASNYDYHLRLDSPDIDAYTPGLYSKLHDVDGDRST